MKKAMVILIVLTTGILFIPNVQIVEAETSNLIIALDNSNSEDTELSAQSDGYSNDTNYGTSPDFEIGWTIVPLFQKRTIIWIQDNYLANNTEIISALIELYIYDFPVMTASSLNISVHELYSNFNETEVTWNNRTNNTVNGPWEIPGGFYNPTSIFEVEMDKDDTGWHKFNITTAYRQWVNNGTQNNGLIFICHDSQDVNRAIAVRSSEFVTASQRPKLNITYSGGNNNPTGSSNLIKNVWNLKGYIGEGKNASTIYSEISNCKVLSGKNATSGYWYTYAPTWGILENWNIEFGDGLFILTTANTTWNHT